MTHSLFAFCSRGRVGCGLGPEACAMPPSHTRPRSLPTGPPEPPLALLLAPLLWAAGHPATRGGSLRGATGPATCSNQQPLDSSRIQGQSSPRIWRRERNGVEEEKEAGKQLSAHPRCRRPRSTPAWCAGRTLHLRGSLTGSPSLLGVPEAQRERGRPHTAGENQATWPGAPPLAPQRLRRLLLAPRGPRPGQLGRVCGRYSIPSVTHLRRNKQPRPQIWGPSASKKGTENMKYKTLFFQRQ